MLECESMKQVKYVCTHCSKKFEAEEKDIVECPGCFWSSSVKRADEVGDHKAAILGAPQKKKAAFRFPWELLLIFLILAGAVYAVYYFRVPLKDLFSRSSSSSRQTIEVNNLDSVDNVPPVTKTPTKKAPTPTQNLVSPWETLSEQDKNILSRRAVFTATRQVSKEESEILSHRAPYKTGLIEKLPSEIWTLERFNEFIESQEGIYKVSFPRSYKKKLEKHFEVTYDPASLAFEQGDMLAARNGWVNSLLIPMYSPDLQKHRGVALTMLRPFITDTLSKISALNNILMERAIRDREVRTSEQYNRLLALLTDRSWQESLDLNLQIQASLDEFMNPERIVREPPAYPPTFNSIDADIRQTLVSLQEIPTPAVSDYQPMLKDLQQKEAVIRSFMPLELEKQTMLFDRGMDAVQKKLLDDAIRNFEKIEFPLALKEDAEEKLEVLRRLRKALL